MTTSISFCTQKHLCASLFTMSLSSLGTQDPPVAACMGLICHSEGVRLSCPVWPRGCLGHGLTDAVGTFGVAGQLHAECLTHGLISLSQQPCEEGLYPPVMVRNGV